MIEFQKVLAHRPHARGGLGRGLAALLALALAAGPVPAARAADTLIDIGTLPGGFLSFPGGINDGGQVTGGADTRERHGLPRLRLGPGRGSAERRHARR